MKQLLFSAALGVGAATFAACSSSNPSSSTSSGSSVSGSGSGSTGVGSTSTSSGTGSSSSGAGGGSPGDAGADGGPGPDTCLPTQTSDIAGVTRQCSGDVYDDFTCDTGAACSATGPLTELFNVYGLTPWYGEYAGAVNVGGDGGGIATITPVNPGTDFFGAKYANGEGMDYLGASQTVCFASTSKYIALRFIPNTARTIHLAQNGSFDSLRQLTVATAPGQFNDGNPAVVCKTLGGGSSALQLSTNGSQAQCVLEIGKTYWLNFYDGGAVKNPNDPDCNGLGGSYGLQVVN